MRVLDKLATRRASWGLHTRNGWQREVEVTECWQQALVLYRDWGAVAMVDQTKEKLASLAKGPVTLVEVKEQGHDTCSLSLEGRNTSWQRIFFFQIQQWDIAPFITF